jgi:hypothetical protein
MKSELGVATGPSSDRKTLQQAMQILPHFGRFMKPCGAGASHDAVTPNYVGLTAMAHSGVSFD